MIGFPARTEAADYYFRYIDLVPEGDICASLRTQASEMLPLLRSISEEQSLHRYAADKWTIRELLNHINDTERLFVARAFWFARGFDSPLPSFDQHVAVSTAAADTRAWSAHVEEFSTVRAATVSFFENLPSEAWMRQGIASDNPFSVRALAYLAVGHVAHHVAILRALYLAGT
jgi:uncharacterized damage-inducible protein DinB